MTESPSPVLVKSPEALSVGGWVLCGTLSLVLLAAVDLALSVEAPGPLAVFAGLSLAAAMGGLVGGVFGLVFHFLSRRSRHLRLLFWSFVGFSSAGGLIFDLGVFTRLSGETRNLALAGLGGSLAMGFAFAVVSLLLQPSVAFPRGRLGSWRFSLRILVASSLLAVSGLTAWMDRTFLPEGYVSAHVALRLTALFGLMFAFSLFLRLPHLSVRKGGFVSAGFLVPFLVSGVALGGEEKAMRVLLDGPVVSLAVLGARGLTDFDVDGYSSLFGGGDCGALDRKINPGRPEIPDNGKDDNCIGGDARPRVVRADEGAWPKEPPTKSVVLITVDTVAALRTSLYGATRDTTPNLKKWAKGAAVFQRAYTTGGWTSLAVPSLHRGVYPRRLSWTRLFETTNWRLLTKQESRKLKKGESIKMMFGLPINDPHVPLAAWLKRRGLYTAAVINDAQSEFLDPKFMATGFDSYRDLDETYLKQHAHASDAQVTQAALAELAKMPKDRPFFLWVHYFGPHLGNSRHRGIKTFGNKEVDRYDHEIVYMDQQVSRLLSALDRLSERRDLAVILTSDHGEVIYETSRGHGRFLSEDGIRVPLVIKDKSFPPGRYKPVASTVDIFPTTLALTGAPVPSNLDGMDLARIVAKDPATRSRVMISETWRYSRSGRRLADSVAAFDGKLKLTMDVITRARSLRKQQRQEDLSQNLLGSEEYDVSHLEEALARHLDARGNADFSD